MVVVALGVLACVIGADYLHARIVGVNLRYPGLYQEIDVDRSHVPGDSFDALLADNVGFTGRATLKEPHADRIRAHLKRAVISALVLYTDRSRSEAIRAVETGSWTDDEVIAAYLSEQKPSTSIRHNLKRILTSQGTNRTMTLRTIEAIDRLKREYR